MVLRSFKTIFVREAKEEKIKIGEQEVIDIKMYWLF